jgi:hypothetical protein
MVFKITATILSILILTVPVPTRPCACCAFEGQWSVHTQEFPNDGKMHRWFVGELSRLRLAGILRAAEHGKGSEFFHKLYNVKLYFDGHHWTVLGAGSDSTGFEPILRFTHPEEYEEFKADNGVRDASFVELYKEWRFAGILEPLSSDVPVAPNQTSLLVLQGYGNNCVSADDFKHWVLNFQIGNDSSRELAVAFGAVKASKAQ